MADSLFFSRDTRVFVRLTDQDALWEIPVLDGFSFSQATNASEVSINEMADASGTSRRARQMFNDSFSPAEWSFSTYARPFYDDGNSKDQSVEQVLWALIAGQPHYTSQSFKSQSSSGTAYIAQDGDLQKIDFDQSNKTTLGTADIWFLMGDSSDNATSNSRLTAYKIEGCVVNEATFDFDLDGIATINWAGFGSIIKEVNAYAQDAAPSTTVAGDDLWVSLTSPAYSASSVQVSLSSNMAASNGALLPTVAGIDNDDNYIRNRLSYLSASSQATGGTATLTLTGGSININNNITFVTPETLGVVNQPLGHVTGTRTVGGSVTCYLNGEAGSSADLFSDLIGATTTITNVFNLTFSIGGGIAEGVPAVQFEMGSCHLELPTHNIEDVISLETTFHALPTSMAETDELIISYAG
jgi:hypothetical protein